MSIKIFGGLAKSHPLKIPPDNITRPTSILLRRKMFDYKQNWENEVFIDACAGSGAMGLEAWSRGAQRVVLVEPNRKAFSILQKNVQFIKDKFPEQCRMRSILLMAKTFQKYWNQRIIQREPEDLSSALSSGITVFIDPPYENHELYKGIIDLVCTDFSISANIWIETERHKGPVLADLNLAEYGYFITKTISQGDHEIGVFQKKEP